MEEEIKNIISKYIKVPAELINSSTVIDRSAVAGSIVLHRMYAALANEGFVIDNYWDIKNFGILLQRSNGQTISTPISSEASEEKIDIANIGSGNNSFNGIGIDIEEIKNLPQVNDFREDEFYKMNFTSIEISYCILQPDVLASFTGLFAAKEAIVKADDLYKNKPFNTIFIDHLPNGKPVFNNFQLSISHTKETAIAIAAKISTTSLKDGYIANNNIPHLSKKKLSPTFIIAIFAFILSLLSIILIAYRH